MEELIILLVSVLSGMATYAVANILKRGAVIASAIVVLSAGLLIPHFFPASGALLATAAACASIQLFLDKPSPANKTSGFTGRSSRFFRRISRAALVSIKLGPFHVILLALRRIV
jgi:hypothetical protein